MARENPLIALSDFSKPTLKSLQHAEAIWTRCRFSGEYQRVLFETDNVVDRGFQRVDAAGECEIDLARRELRVCGSAVPIGRRAFEVIEVLAQSGGEVVTKNELMDRIWPGAVVTENTLHVHAVAIRKALGPYRTLLKTEPGRGYRLLGDWKAPEQSEGSRPPDRAPRRSARDAFQSNLPAATSELVGRVAVMQRLMDLLSAYRVVTLSGTGGIGKSRLALEAARLLLPTYAGEVFWVELASLADGGLLPSTIAAVFGLKIPQDAVSVELLAQTIGDRRLLLVIDNCEHLIDYAAEAVEKIVRSCPAVSVLTTSREPLRIEGECVHRVPPLDVPAWGEGAPLESSAVRLFNARMTERLPDVLSDAELATIAAICRRLDGIPLAIEFAAARAAVIGIGEVLSHLDDRFALLTSGRRTALPKHQTLRAAMDWSSDLLPPVEKVVLRRLAVFRGAFATEAAGTVVGDKDIRSLAVIEILANLSEKSLVVSDVSRGIAYHYMHETTRAYALEKLTGSGELRELSRRHAQYYRGSFERIEDEWDKRTKYLADMDNVRAALEWCFSVDGDLEVGVKLAAAAAPVFLVLSLVAECHRWSERALTALDDDTDGGSEEMHLQASLGVSYMQLAGQGDAARVALNRSLAIAEARGDALSQAGLLGMLSMFHTRGGEFKTALHYAKLSRAVAGAVRDPACIASAQSALGRSLHFMGDHNGARAELEASFHYQSRSRLVGETYLGLDRHVLDGLGLARILWLQGHPNQCAECIRRTVEDAESRNRPASLAVALSWAPGIFLWIGDLRDAEEHADWLISHAEAHSLGPYLAVGRGYKGALAVRRGDARGGVEDLQACLEQLCAMRYEMRYTEFKLSLVQGLVGIGQFAEGMTLVDETIRLVEANGELLYMPEALRVKGSVLLANPSRRVDEAQMCFIQSLDWSRRQGARSWELRTAIDLAALWAAQGQLENARALLSPIFEQFVEGSDMADLKAAEHLLATLQ
jgi:predicted ATPase/DNA-binding winged helix-turn-helix (wHTH) protein